MQLVVGQRYMSEAEPELGLGAVTGVSGKQVTLSFSDGERTYGTATAPIKRILFAVGDSVRLFDESEGPVEAVRHEDGLYFYTVAGTEISEMVLSHRISFTSPLDRLSQGICDRNRDYEVRLLAQSLRQQSEASPARGYVGGKIELFPHQFSVAQAICEAHNRRFLLADEVGLGKTIEAALALHRLLLIGEVHRVLIVVPSALLHQWFVELYRRFALLATVVNGDLRNRFASDHSLFEFEPLLIISSEDFLAGDDLSQAVSKARWDMLIIDEAHHLNYSDDSFNTIAMLSGAVRDLLLLTASPDALEPRAFFALMQLIDCDKYQTFDRFLQETHQYDRVATIAEKVLENQPLDPAEEELLQREVPVLLPRLNNAHSVSERQSVVRALVDICGVGRSLFRNSRAVITGFPRRSVELVPLEGVDEGLVSLPVMQWINQFLLKEKSAKVLLICQDMSRLRLLERALNNVKSRKVALFHEEMSLVQLDRNAAWFADPEGASLLIATEVGAEGRNFQYADHLIMTDLPDEPEQLEQRIGRLDRIGRSSDVSVIIPYVNGSEMARKADWYHRGLGAFEQTVPGAHLLGKEFITDLHRFSGSDTEWELFIGKTISEARTIRERVERGRSRLLELASCDYEQATNLIFHVNKAESRHFSTSVEQLFAFFGITMEEHGAGIFFLDFDMLTEHTFPVPALREEGMSITFERSVALAREDVDLLTIDHPMVQGAVELLLGTEKGNVGCARLPHAGEEGVLVEFLYTMRAPQGSETYFPSQSLRFMYDEYGDEVSDVFSFDFLGKSLERADFSHPQLRTLSLAELLMTLEKSAVTLAEESVEQLRKSALERLEERFSTEVERVSTLSGNSRELEKIRSERVRAEDVVAQCEPLLDAVRIIILEK